MNTKLWQPTQVGDITLSVEASPSARLDPCDADRRPRPWSPGFDFKIHASFVNRPYISYLRTATLGTNFVQPRENVFLSQ